MKKKKKTIYLVEYASGSLLENGGEKVKVFADKGIKVGTGVILRSTAGLVLGRIIEICDKTYEELLEKGYNDEQIQKQVTRTIYKFVDLDDFYEEIEKRKRKEELELEMENKFKDLDKKLKFKFYAEQDPEFKKMYEEYKNL